MQIFPYVLIRICGGSFKNLKQLQLSSSVQIAGEIHDLKRSLSSLKETLNDSLYTFIGEQTNDNVRLALINTKRDIYNERSVPIEILNQIQTYLPRDILEEIKHYNGLRKKIENIWSKGEKKYLNELSDSRNKLRPLIKDETLLKGLVLSSQSLLNYGIPKYLISSSTAVSRDEEKIEQSLIRYISRIHTKTSPFGTFTNLALGKLADARNEICSPENLIRTSHKQLICESHIRLNNHIFQYLRDIMAQCPEISRRFSIRPNPTITKENEYYLFLTNSNNKESFQRLAHGYIPIVVVQL